MTLVPLTCNTQKVMTVVMRELYSVGCIGALPFIEGLLETVQSGLLASSCDSEEHP